MKFVQEKKQDIRPEFLYLLSNELSYLENNFKKNLPSTSSLLIQVVNHIFNAGGKRIRPAVCLLVAKATGEITKKHLILAELTELIHTASLIHDDIIDSARTRRGVQTLNSIWNNKISVIAGDYLFAQASVRLGEIESNEIVKTYAKVLSDLCDGEIKQFTLKFNTEIDWNYYLEKSEAKTASLFEASCKCSALLNGLDLNLVNSAKLFGKYIGIAFQIKDDILDFTSSKDSLGKESYSDLKEGIITAPTLFALKSSDSRKEQLKNLIEKRFMDDPIYFDQAVRLVFELGGIEKAEALVNEYIEKAKESLIFAKDKNITEHLVTLAEYISKRS